MKNIVINGFGRIGRLAFRELMGSSAYRVIAINSHSDPEELAYLLKYDTVHGVFGDGEIDFDDNNLFFDGEVIKCYKIDNPEEFPWADLNVDCVLECTGAYTKYEDAMKHIAAGAKHVIISAPGKGHMKTIVYGVNDYMLKDDDYIISAASCTTNCLAPVLNIIDHNFGIETGFMTTIHAMTNDQNSLDGTHKKGIASRRGRASAYNIVPATTGAASAIGEVLPNLKGKLDGIAFRVPVSDGSCIDLSLTLVREASIEEINDTLKNNTSMVLKYTEDPVVSSDIIGNKCGSLVDGASTKVLDYDKHVVKIIAWYDNELGYTCQMLRTMDKLLNL
jgi:glyceraldehyde 3-phosphate dehydrogenase